MEEGRGERREKGKEGALSDKCAAMRVSREVSDLVLGQLSDLHLHPV